ncbi:hypothetical protein LL06_18665 [Hoeflea sp. BAL378]|uniref:PepSY domain-containing protein n=1 Tax=Hoeflea sp. BAL378 TaxID=1547437 RepID=UPI000513AFD2|nr:PepSY domain-containing protein [Hoeflea sp. BAL378]KGF68067.1 hypothetical protein LL06_18665 [Hoeflea sp. BAL378]
MKRSLLILLLLAAIPPAWADRKDDHHDRARLDEALARGEVLHLSEILKKVGPRIEGRILEIEFEYSRRRPIYEIYVLTPDGRRMEYEIDARTADILRLEDED